VGSSPRRRLDGVVGGGRRGDDDGAAADGDVQEVLQLCEVKGVVRHEENQRRKRLAVAAPNSSLPTAYSIGEVDKRQCQVAGKMAVRSVLAGAGRSRGKTKGGARHLLY
jgi:hypothetical protein